MMYTLLLLIYLHIATVVCGCGNTYTEHYGSVTSPNYPNKYPNRQDCMWKISTYKETRISLVFTDFKIEYENDCSYDRVTLKDGITGQQLDKPLCGNKLPKPVLSSGNVVFVNFISDYSERRKGFKLEWRASLVCDDVINSNNGTVTSPNYPVWYSHLLNCVWIVTVDTGNFIALDIDMDIEDSDKCKKNFIKVYEGNSTKQKYLLSKPLCGKNKTTLKSPSKTITIQFQSDNSGSRNKGFVAHWKAEFLDCEEVIHSNNGTVTSPNYPDAYYDLLNCSWIITVDAGHYITLDIDMDIEESDECQHDFIMHLSWRITSQCQHPFELVYEGNATKQNNLLSGPLCGNNKTTLKSASKTVTIQFKSDRSDRFLNKGFIVSWKAGMTNEFNRSVYSGAVYAGIVIGTLIVLAAIVCVAVITCKRRKSFKHTSSCLFGFCDGHSRTVTQNGSPGDRTAFELRQEISTEVTAEPCEYDVTVDDDVNTYAQTNAENILRFKKNSTDKKQNNQNMQDNIYNVAKYEPSKQGRKVGNGNNQNNKEDIKDMPLAYTNESDNVYNKLNEKFEHQYENKPMENIYNRLAVPDSSVTSCPENNSGNVRYITDTYSHVQFKRDDHPKCTDSVYNNLVNVKVNNRKTRTKQDEGVDDTYGHLKY